MLKIHSTWLLIRSNRCYVFISSQRTFSDEKKKSTEFSADDVLKIIKKRTSKTDFRQKLADKETKQVVESSESAKKPTKFDILKTLTSPAKSTFTPPDFKSARKKVSSEKADEEKLDKNLVDAADAVAKILGKDEIKSDLLKKLISCQKESADEAAKPVLPSVLSSMIISKRFPDRQTADEQVDKFQQSFDDTRLDEAAVEKRIDQLRERFGSRGQERDSERDREVFKRQTQQPKLEETYEEIDLLDGERLNVFDPNKLPEKSKPLMELWDKLEEKHVTWLTTMAPRNGFEEMIRWTEEGKMFPFPRDNEFGLYEKHVSFHEHVFLDHLIKDGFPATGPIRRFMELVCVGLSKNPYMTVEKKRGHIEWFKDYFKDRWDEIEKLKLVDEEEERLKQTV